jgi:hypothetical protein
MAGQSSGVGDVLKYGLILGGGYLLYQKFFGGATPAAAAPAGAAPASPTYSIADLIAAVKGTAGSGTAGGGSAPSGQSSDPWANAAACMQMAAGNDSQNFDQWSYWFQNMSCSFRPLPAGFGTGTATNPTISADLMGKIIAAGGGDRSKLVSSAAWIGYYRSAAGLSGLGAVSAPAAVTVPIVIFPVGEGRFAVVGRRMGRPFHFTVAAGRR